VIALSSCKMMLKNEMVVRNKMVVLDFSQLTLVKASDSVVGQTHMTLCVIDSCHLHAVIISVC